MSKTRARNPKVVEGDGSKKNENGTNNKPTSPQKPKIVKPIGVQSQQPSTPKATVPETKTPAPQTSDQIAQQAALQAALLKSKAEAEQLALQAELLEAKAEAEQLEALAQPESVQPVKLQPQPTTQVPISSAPQLEVKVDAVNAESPKATDLQEPLLTAQQQQQANDSSNNNNPPPAQSGDAKVQNTAKAKKEAPGKCARFWGGVSNYVVSPLWDATQGFALSEAAIMGANGIASLAGATSSLVVPGGPIVTFALSATAPYAMRYVVKPALDMASNQYHSFAERGKGILNRLTSTRGREIGARAAITAGVAVVAAATAAIVETNTDDAQKEKQDSFLNRAVLGGMGFFACKAVEKGVKAVEICRENRVRKP